MRSAAYNALRQAGAYVTSRSRCAARYAALTGCSITDAARDLGVSPGGAWLAWSRIYPGVAQPTSERRRRIKCAVCGAHGHPAINGRCSRSAVALRLVADGASVARAAKAAGLTTGAVYAAQLYRRRAA